MNITFFIGNGFDLSFNLKTGYKSFYEYLLRKYKTKKSLYKEQTGKEYEEKLVESISSDSDLWSDLELGLGKYLKIVNTDKDVAEFFESKEELERCLIDYLQKENDRFSITDDKKLAKCFRDKVVGFSKAFSQKELEHYNGFINNTSGINYHFITFNYTDVLDRIIATTNKSIGTFSTHTTSTRTYTDYLKNPIHIHGTLKSGLILALNDVSQIDNEKLQKDSAFTDLMIKSKLNEDLGNYRTRSAKKIIDDSMYICIFGMSIGDTDNLWWQYITDWLLQNKDRRIVWYVRNSSASINTAGAYLRFARKKQKEFALHAAKSTGEDFEKIKAQVVVIVNSDVFKLDGIKINSVEKENKTPKIVLSGNAIPTSAINSNVFNIANKAISNITDADMRVINDSIANAVLKSNQES